MKPVLIAHRGDPAHAPENTLASFESALRKGARAVEMDARQTADGVWVAFHDSTLRRMTGRPGRLDRHSWRALQSLRAHGEPIPKISDVLSLCRRRRAAAFLDIKVAAKEKSLFQVLRRSGIDSRIWVGAGKFSSLRRWRRLLGDRPLFWVTGYRTKISKRRVALAKRLKLSGLVAYKGWASPAAVKRVHQAGLKLYVWTLRSRVELARYAARGVDGLMSEVWPPPSI